MSENVFEKTRKLHITPVVAQEILNSHCENRKLNKKKVEVLAEIIKSGGWKYNGEAIIISDNGRLLDGQHRLSAVILADVNIESLVVWGVSEDAFNTIDTGKSRTAADIISTKESGCYATIASVARLVVMYEKDHTLGDHHIHISQVAARGMSDRKIIDTVAFVMSYPKNKINRTLSAFLFYLVFDEPQRDEFFERLFIGNNLDATSPILRLRERMMNFDTGLRGGTSRKIAIALYFKAWNAFVKGKKITCLRWGLGTEGFPVLELTR